MLAYIYHTWILWDMNIHEIRREHVDFGLWIRLAPIAWDKQRYEENSLEHIGTQRESRTNHSCFSRNMGVSINRGTEKVDGFFRGKSLKKWMMTGGTPP